MRGQPKNISLPRRLIVDLMHASMGVPFVSLSRSLDIGPLLEARAGAMAPAQALEPRSFLSAVSGELLSWQDYR